MPSSRAAPSLPIAIAMTCLAAACSRESVAPHALDTLKLATWNLEWFMTPETLQSLSATCTPRDAPRDGARRSVPCDVAHEGARSHEDIEALRRYARELDADIIALQEVDGPEAARLLFTAHEFCFSRRVAVQNTGFAIRRGIPFECGPDLHELSLNDAVRRGVELRVFPGTPREMRLLTIHLKSGCSRDPLDSQRQNCRDLARQLPALEQWIDEQARAGRPYAVLGDFNRDLRREPAGDSFWRDLDDGDPAESDLVNTADGSTFQNCMPSQTFSGYIDYIVLGTRMARGLENGSFGRALYRPVDAVRRKLSDHCPVFIRLRVADATTASP
jgi:endonuclease/exonuclease/phosphatase family metal-dependent hydrolase